MSRLVLDLVHNVFFDRRVAKSSASRLDNIKDTYRLRNSDQFPINQWLYICGILRDVSFRIVRNLTQVSVAELEEGSRLDNGDTQTFVLSKPTRNSKSCRSTSDNDIVVGGIGERYSKKAAKEILIDFSPDRQGTSNA